MSLLQFLNNGYFAGKVGIGTVTNSAEETNNGIPRLQVTTTTAVLGEFPLAARFTTASDAGDNSGVSVLINSGNDRGLMISAGRQTGNTSKVTLNVVDNNGDELDTITMLQNGQSGSSANVGIGTTGPATKLQVNGGVLLGSTYSQPAGSSFTTANSQLILGGAHNAEFNTSGVKLLISGYNNDGGVAVYPIFAQDENGNDDFWIRNRLTDTALPRAYFAGDVGIGTVSPSARLEVLGTNNDEVLRIVRGNINSQYLAIRGYQVLSQGNHMLLSADNAKEVWIGHASNTQELVINTSGNVGIGTTGPSTKLEVSSSGAEGILISKDTGTTSNSGRLFFETDTVSEGFSFLNSNGLMTIRSQAQAGATSGNARVAINGSGNVGIGTTSPGYKLDVNGSVNAAYGATEFNKTALQE